jgi:hypothetical protein
MAFPDCGPCMSGRCERCWGLCGCLDCARSHSHKQVTFYGRIHGDNNRLVADIMDAGFGIDLHSAEDI